MAIVFNSAETAQTITPSFTHVLNVPPATSNGDLMFAAHGWGREAGGSLPAITTPAGWTTIFQLEDNPIGADNVRLRVYFRVASSEPASYTWTTNFAVSMNRAILLYNGVDSISPIDASGSVGDITSPFSCPSIVTVAENAMVLRVGLCPGGAEDWATRPAGALRVDLHIPFAGSQGPTALEIIESGIQAVPGATGIASFTNSFNSFGAMGTVSLTPSLAVGGATTKVTDINDLLELT